MKSSSPEARPEISVLLLTKNAGPRFDEVLDSLFACREIGRSEVIVVDSGSSDGTVERVESRPGVQLHRLSSEEFGHGRTRNLAASMSRGEFLVFLVQDATPLDSEFLGELVEPLRQDPGLAATYGRQIARSEASPVEAEFLRHTYPETPSERRLEGGSDASIGAVFFSNVCSTIRRDVWERFRFDEDLIMSEDQKWAREVLGAGYRIAYRPSAAVLHSHHYGLERVFRRNFDSGYSLVGVTEDRWHSMLGYELDLLASAARGLWRRGRGRWIPRLLAHELVRSLGFLMGRIGRWLPRPLRRRLSLHRAYWVR